MVRALLALWFAINSRGTLISLSTDGALISLSIVATVLILLYYTPIAATVKFNNLFNENIIVFLI